MDARRLAFVAIGSLSVATLVAWYISRVAKRRTRALKQFQSIPIPPPAPSGGEYPTILLNPPESSNEEIDGDEECEEQIEQPIMVDRDNPYEDDDDEPDPIIIITTDENQNPEIEIETSYPDKMELTVDTLDDQLEDQPQILSSVSPLADLLNSGELEQFSWSEEVERSYQESLDENDGMNADRQTIESPSLHSQDSDGSSGDSGRATGGLASSLSPHDEAPEILPQYEFEIPNSLVGLVIGVKGKTIKELSTRTNVKMLIRPHHTPSKVDTHQICQVRGKRDQINKCLCMLRKRFPPHRFPELNLQPVMPPPLPSNVYDALHSQPTWLTLPEGVSTEVVVSSFVDPGHIFLQQPTHPSFSSLNLLDRYMLHLYSQDNGIPMLPEPCETGLLCAAPVLGVWFRAVTVLYYQDKDEVLVRFVDYGGYRRMPRAELRQIRTDLMTLPFQANECYLAHVQPVDGTSQWGEEAISIFKETCMGKVIEAHIIGYHVDDRVPFVELSAPTPDGKIERVDVILMNSGLAKASDPSKLCRNNQKRI